MKLRPAHALVAAALAASAWVVHTLAPGDPSSAPQAPPLVARAAGPPRDASLILVVNDTMRADRVGVYGGPAHTPVFDAFARRHVSFEQVWSPAPWTLPSIASLFTSLAPSRHGVVTPALEAEAGAERPEAIAHVRVLAEEAVTLAELLREAGFRTAAFVSNPWMNRELGLAQGFETYDDAFARWDLPGTEVSEAALAWLRSLAPDERFFLYVHYLDSHRPYGSLEREAVSERALEIASDARPLSAEAGRLVASMVRFEDGRPVALDGHRPSLTLLEMAYDQGLADFDRALGRLLEGVEAGAFVERTAIVVTSDHGEALFERGWGNHGYGLFEDEIRIPLAARLPGLRQPARYREPVALVDVMPTVCGYLGVRCPAGLSGANLLEPAPPRYLLAEGVMWSPEDRAIRNGRLKLLWRPRPAGEPLAGHFLFDLMRDPGEARNLLLERPSTRAALEVMAPALAEAGAARPELPQQTSPLDPDTQQRLRALGYLN